MAPSRRVLAAVTVSVALLVAAALVVLPPLRHADRLDGRIASARAQLAHRQAGARGADPAPAASAGHRAARRLRVALPPSGQAPDLIRALDAEATHAGTRLVTADAVAAPAAPAATPAPGIALPGQKMTLGYAGPYGALERVVHRLATHVRDVDGHLHVTGQLVSIQGLQVAREGAGNRLQATVAATAHLAPDTAAATP